MLEKPDKANREEVKSKLYLYITIFLLIVFNASIRLVHLKGWYAFKQLFFINESKPLMTTQDGYYYLRIAADYKKGNFGSKDDLSPIGHKPYPISLLSLMDSTISTLTGLTLEKVAFYLPVFLSCFMVLVYLVWGVALDGRKFFTISALIGCSVFYWYTRTCLGRFDTDSLLPFFVFIIPFFAHKFSTSVGVKPRILNFICIVVLCLLFYLWWIPARYLIIPLVFLTYAVTLFTVKSSKLEQIFKTFILLLGFFAGILFLLMWFSIIPSSGIFQRAISLLQLTVHKGNSALPDISKSISELAPLSFSQLTSKVAGNTFILIISFFGLIWLAIEKRNIFVSLAVPLALAVLSLKSRRFMIFHVPFFAMGTAFIICKVSSLKILKKNKYLEYAAIFLLTLVFLYFAGRKTVKYVVPPRPSSVHASIASTINTGHKPKDTVWSWWDYGYFLEYMTDKRAFIDGGSQSSLRSFLAAFPFPQQNPQIAASWIRLFSIRDEGLFWQLTRYTKSHQRTVDFLKKAFEHPRQIHKLVKQYNLPAKNWKKILFPDGKVYVYLPFDMIDSSPWWFYFGTWNFEQKKGSKLFILKVPPQSLINQKKGVLILPSKRILLKDMLTYSTKPNIGLYVSKFFRNPTEKHLIAGRVFNYVVDTEFLQSTFARLLFSPDKIPQFKRIKYAPYYGGIWEVIKSNPQFSSRS